MSSESFVEAAFRVAERFGVPLVLLAVGIWFMRDAAVTLHGTVVVPMEHIEEALAIAQKVKATEERVIAAIRAGGDPVEVHEKVNYDNMLKADQPL